MTDPNDAPLDAPIKAQDSTLIGDRKSLLMRGIADVLLSYYAGWCLLLFWWLQETWLRIFLGTTMQTIGLVIAAFLCLTLYPHLKMAFYVGAWRKKVNLLSNEKATVKLTLKRGDKKITQYAQGAILIHAIVLMVVLGRNVDQARANWWWGGIVAIFFLLSVASWRYVLYIIAFKKQWCREHPLQRLSEPS